MPLRLAVVTGVVRWLARRLDGWLAAMGRDALANQVDGLVAAHERLAETIDRRLRSLEETAARGEAEVRFMATLLGQQDGAEPPRTGVDRSEPSRRTGFRHTRRPASDGAGDEVAE
ncbi:MAG: hypothetical protein ACRD2C_09540 [Acidimicrobiales bacterium]